MGAAAYNRGSRFRETNHEFVQSNECEPHRLLSRIWFEKRKNVQ